MKPGFIILIFFFVHASMLCAQPTRVVIHDSSFFERIRSTRSTQGKLDFREPNNQRFLAGRTFSGHSPPLIYTSSEGLFSVNSENDIYNYTDRFYTNGIHLLIAGPFLADNILNNLLVPYFGSGRNYYGIEVVQNMYTPSTTKVGGIHFGDRPYAAYLYAGIFKITTDPVHMFRQTNAIRVGMIGPLSFGAWLQTAFHNNVPTNDKPLGWEYQVANDLVVNWELRFEKGIYQRRHFEIHLRSTGSLGTLYTNMGGGLFLRAGWMNPYYYNLGITKRRIAMENGLRNFQFVVFLSGAGRMVGYDATLQGGVLNHQSIYVLPSGDISRFVAQSSLGINLTWSGIRLEAEQYLLSPEFRDGLWHRWVRLGLTFAL